jgi:hypothetical protein
MKLVVAMNSSAAGVLLALGLGLAVPTLHGQPCEPEWDPTIGVPGMSNGVFALTVFDDGAGPALYAGGGFSHAGGQRAVAIAKWDAGAWHPVGDGMSGDGPENVYALTVDDGADPALYAAGLFQQAGGVLVRNVAKWGGVQWSDLDGGVSGGPAWPDVLALAVFDDGTGPALYVGGRFEQTGGLTVNNIAKWDGAQWSALGSGTTGGDGVHALAVFDDGTGPALFATGSFSEAGGVSADNIAKWDGSTWSPLDAGLRLASGCCPFGSALTVFDDGTGPALYVGGQFTLAGEGEANYIARWDGTAWAPLLHNGDPGQNGTNDPVFALSVFNDGGGPALYAGGNFTATGGAGANRVAQWNGTQWSPLDVGVDYWVQALIPFDDGDGLDLYVGGWFTHAGGQSANYIATWTGCPPECPGDLDGDGDTDLSDLAALLAAYGTSVGDPGHNPSADFDSDGDVDLSDLAFLLADYGCGT